MPNVSILQKVFALSPHVEMIGRLMYWRNVKKLSEKAKRSRKANPAERQAVDFSKIEQHLKQNGVQQGCLLLVHSAFGPLKGAGIKPNGILDILLALVGREGTLAMPAIASYPNDPPPQEYLSFDVADEVFVYDVEHSPISTGVLPKLLAKREGAVRSRHPINSMVAAGPLAKHLMTDNLAGDSPLACGVNSSWKKCVDANAWIIGLGTDLTHSLTMIHVAEDVMDQSWPVQPWYREKKYLVKDGDYSKEFLLRERKPKWGALHFGERTLCKDLINEGLLKTTTIDGVIVEILKATDLIDFLNSKNQKGYPYFWVNR